MRRLWRQFAYDEGYPDRLSEAESLEAIRQAERQQGLEEEYWWKHSSTRDHFEFRSQWIHAYARVDRRTGTVTIGSDSPR
jgi:hypothetical protein